MKWLKIILESFHGRGGVSVVCTARAWKRACLREVINIYDKYQSRALKHTYHSRVYWSGRLIADTACASGRFCEIIVDHRWLIDDRILTEINDVNHCWLVDDHRNLWSSHRWWTIIIDFHLHSTRDHRW